MNKICIIGCYFGTFPSYFDLWLKSCEFNPNIDFLIFTNCEKKDFQYPQNVKIININLADIKERLDNILGIDVKLISAYKCCDCKPLYGKIFKDYLENYDFWGHCDFDLIWGDLSKFFNQYHQEDYDKFLSLGHLSLYRNSIEVNDRYLLDGSLLGTWEDVYSVENNLGFDEDRGIYAIYKKNQLSMFEKRIFADISPSYKRFRCARKDKNYPYQVFFWRDGATYRAYWHNGEMKEEEFIYIHFQKRGVMPIHEKIDFNKGFFITNSGFYPMHQRYVSLDDIKRLNPYKSEIYEKIEKILNKVCKKLLNIRKNLFKKR